MTSAITNTDDPHNFGPVSPVIPADDVEQRLGFYVETLGFTEVFRSGSPTDYAGIARGLATIHIFACAELNIAKWTALRIPVRRIDDLFDRCKAAGVVHPNGDLALRGWGSREFTVLDPSGVGITFTEHSD